MKTIFSILYLIFHICLYSFVLMKISEWHFIPKFGLPSFKFEEYIGFSLFVATVKFKINYREVIEMEELDLEDKIKSKLLINIVLLLVLVLGYILKILNNGF